MYLETRKGFVDGRSLDAMNLATLRQLMKPKPAGRKSGKAPKL
jgi:hypothetical protein